MLRWRFCSRVRVRRGIVNAAGSFWRSGRRGDGCGGFAQRREQQPTTRMSGVGLSARRSPDDAAIRQLSIHPSAECFEQVVFSTQTRQIRRAGRPHRIRNRMVQIAAIRRLVTARESTRQISAPHEVGQLARRRIPRLRRAIPWMNQRADRRRGRDFGSQQRCGHDPTTDHHGRVGFSRTIVRLRGKSRSGFRDRHLPQRLIQRWPARRFPVELHGGVIGQTALLGDDMDHRRTRGSIAGHRALWATAGTRQVLPATQRGHRIGAALINGAWIVLTHPTRHLP